MKNAWFAVVALSCIEMISVTGYTYQPVIYQPVIHPYFRDRRWIPDRYANEDFGVEATGSSQSFDGGNGNGGTKANQNYLSYFWPEYSSNSGSSAGDYSGMLYRANDNVKGNHESMDPVQQLHSVQAYSYAQMLQPYGYNYNYNNNYGYYGRTQQGSEGQASTNEASDLGGRALGNLRLLKNGQQGSQPATLFGNQPFIFLAPNQGASSLLRPVLTKESEVQDTLATATGARKPNVLKLRKNSSGMRAPQPELQNRAQEAGQAEGTEVQRLTASDKARKTSSNQRQQEDQTNDSESSDSDQQIKPEGDREISAAVLDANQEQDVGSLGITDSTLEQNPLEDVEPQSLNEQNADSSSVMEVDKTEGRAYNDPMYNPYISNNYRGSPLPSAPLHLVYTGSLPPVPIRSDIPSPYYSPQPQYTLPIYGYPSGIPNSPVPYYNLPNFQSPIPYGPTVSMRPPGYQSPVPYFPSGYAPSLEPSVNRNMVPNDPGYYGVPQRNSRQITYNWQTVQPKPASG